MVYSQYLTIEDIVAEQAEYIADELSSGFVFKKEHDERGPHILVEFGKGHIAIESNDNGVFVIPEKIGRNAEHEGIKFIFFIKLTRTDYFPTEGHVRAYYAWGR